MRVDPCVDRRRAARAGGSWWEVGSRRRRGLACLGVVKSPPSRKVELYVELPSLRSGQLSIRLQGSPNQPRATGTCHHANQRTSVSLLMLLAVTTDVRGDPPNRLAYHRLSTDGGGARYL